MLRIAYIATEPPAPKVKKETEAQRMRREGLQSIANYHSKARARAAKMFAKEDAEIAELEASLALKQKNLNQL